ncbi:DUF1574 family protein [Novipirellula maiorica]|uniref:DUF1574 family protein n=1 Tax=Novipirellula maiorica TaxID=1265734 RepID=UPI0003484BFF|nr:DUF1574 family protein [Rhodopirellula maiorica]
MIKSIRFPIAVVLAMGLLTLGGFLLSTTKATWYFVEWAKIRTPNPSFGRNTLFWEQRNFEQAGSPDAKTKVVIVGSSQPNQGFSLNWLEMACQDIRFEKNCLAGFGPMQYPFLNNRISERRPQIVVCHLSEFDFFREDAVPIERLRWAATLSGTKTVFQTLTAYQAWKNRGALGDLAFSSVIPYWRHRDHFRRTLFGYWWNKSESPKVDSDQPTPLAVSSTLDEAIFFLKKNIGRKELVEANFASFHCFAQQLKQQHVKLIVVEGQVHPNARRVYDTEHLQQETRMRLKAMATELEFVFFETNQMPTFTPADFADAYHLNDDGRRKLSDFLAEHLKMENN